MNLAPPQPAISWAQPVWRSRATAYLLAGTLPFGAAYLTAHVGVLQATPFALYFILIAAIGALWGLEPSLVAATFCGAAWAWIARGRALLPIGWGDGFHFLTLYAMATLVNVLSRRRGRASEQLTMALSALQERTDALVDSVRASKCACWVLDLESGQSARWYSGSYQVFGRPFEELEKLPSLRPLLHPEDQPRLAELAEAMRTTWGPLVFEHRVPWPNGELHYLEMRATRVEGAGCVWRGVTVDITERKLAEMALLRQEKLAAMGRLASTVAHEINNPLEAVTNLLYLARSETAMSEETRTYLATAEQELARLGDITRLTLGFVRNTSVRRALALDGVVNEVLSIFRHRYEQKHIAIERRIEPGVCVEMAPHELRQILTNLISNAADALNLENPRIVIQILAEPPNAVFVLEDNGSGIPEHVLPRIFDPFFTTKADVGTGIGLWVTRQLVESNGGVIGVESGALEDGMATRFRVELPLVRVAGSAALSL
jgi:signal transduction histidine kinase